jgi:hypothetical protein
VRPGFGRPAHAPGSEQRIDHAHRDPDPVQRKAIARQSLDKPRHHRDWVARQPSRSDEPSCDLCGGRGHRSIALSGVPNGRRSAGSHPAGRWTIRRYRSPARRVRSFSRLRVGCVKEGLRRKPAEAPATMRGIVLIVARYAGIEIVLQFSDGAIDRLARWLFETGGLNRSWTFATS